jgi:hypothetical protein
MKERNIDNAGFLMLALIFAHESARKNSRIHLAPKIEEIQMNPAKFL